MNQCAKYLKHKKRRCQNKTKTKYCHLHVGRHAVQSGGNAEDLQEKTNEFLSKYEIESLYSPPDPPQNSWYHYHAPITQRFGDYLCVKRSFLRDIGEVIDDLSGDNSPKAN